MDEELIERIKRGDPEAAEGLRQRFGALIRYIVEAILPDPRDAEECVNDVYLKLLSAGKTLDPARPLKPFAAAVARNAAVSRAELDESLPGGSTPEEELLRRERAESLKRALNTLSVSDRRLLYRKYYYCQSTAQIAAELGTTERAVEGKLYRLKRRLRELMGGEDDG